MEEGVIVLGICNRLKFMITGIVSFIGLGKDTVTQEFVKRGCIQDSFAAPLKDLCAVWLIRHLVEGDTVESRDPEKSDLYWSKRLGVLNFTRLALQLMGTEVMRNPPNARYLVKQFRI